MDVMVCTNKDWLGSPDAREQIVYLVVHGTSPV